MIATIALVPLIQIGLTYYLSVQTFLAITLSRSLRYHKSTIHLIIISSTFFFSKFIVSGFIAHDVMRTLREWIAFSLIILSARGLKNIDLPKAITALKIVLALTASFVLTQKLCILLIGAMPHIPMELFVSNQATLEGVQKALEHQTRVRPVGFFGEPSYCASVLLIIYSIILKYKPSESRPYTILSALTIITLESLSGAIVFALIHLLGIEKIKLNIKSVLTTILGVAIFIYLALGTELGSRIASIFIEGSDVSTNVRFLIPINILFSSISDLNLLGATNSTINSLIAQNNIYTLDNGIIYNATAYGLFSLAIYFTIFKQINNNSVFAIFMSMNLFNGSVFSLDKAILFSILISLHYEITRRNNKTSQPQSKKYNRLPELYSAQIRKNA